MISCLSCHLHLAIFHRSSGFAKSEFPSYSSTLLYVISQQVLIEILWLGVSLSAVETNCPEKLDKTILSSIKHLKVAAAGKYDNEHLSAFRGSSLNCQDHSALVSHFDPFITVSNLISRWYETYLLIVSAAFIFHKTSCSRFVKNINIVSARGIFLIITPQ